MTDATSVGPSRPGDSVEVTCVVAAPPTAVYQAFLDPETLSRWYGPATFTVLQSSIDARIGGHHRTQVAGRDGVRGWFISTILDLVPNQTIVMSWSWVAETPSPSQPPQGASTVTINLRPAGPESTHVAIVHERLGGPPHEDSGGIAAAWAQALEDLSRIL